MLSINLAGFPPVVRARVRGSCNSTPGRATVECVVGNGTAPPWPDMTTLTMSDGSTSLSWGDMRVVKSPRVRGGVMRVVLEDSRWKLRETILGGDYNQLDSSGVSLVASQTTMSALASTVGSKSFLDVVAGGVIPAYTPPAPWGGSLASQALDGLLRDAVCRLHYDPTTGRYSIWSAGTGNYPALANRLYSPSPNRGIRTLYVRSAPILYEASMIAEAVVEDGTGQIVNISAHDPDEYFSGFPSIADPVLQRKLKEGAFRLWQVSATNKRLKNHRALSLISGSNEAKYMGAKLVHADLAGQMQELDVTLVRSISHRDETGYGIYYSPTPFLESSGASLKTTAEIIAAYNTDSNAGLQREIVTRAVSSTGSDRAINVHWIRPIDSSQPDVPASQWTTHLNAVANALQTSFANNPHTVTLPGLVASPPSGHIGAYEYYAQIQPTATLLTRFALDFDASPGDIT